MNREPFTYWCCSLPNKDAPRTLNNSQHTFSVKLPKLWNFSDEWEVFVQSVICSEVLLSETHKGFLLYSDLIEYELVGHDKFPLLEWLPPALDSHVRHQESFHPYIRRLAKSHFDHIGFKIVDTRGQTPKFIRDSPTFIALHFRPIPTNQNSTMDITLLSNQSKIYFPSNAPNRFTAQLPSIIKLEANEWKVALSKATLPAVSISNVVTQLDEKILLSFTPFEYPKFKSTHELELAIPNARWSTLESLISYINKALEKAITKLDFVASDGSKSKFIDEMCRDASSSGEGVRTVNVEKWEHGKLVDSHWKSHVFPQDQMISLKTLLKTIQTLGFKIQWQMDNDPQYRLLTLTNLNPGFQRIQDNGLLEELGFKPLRHDKEHQLAHAPPFFRKKMVIPFFNLKLKWSKKTQRVILRSELWSKTVRAFSVGFTKGLNDILGLQEQSKVQSDRGGQTFCHYLLCNGLKECDNPAINGPHIDDPTIKLAHPKQSSIAAFYPKAIVPMPRFDWSRTGFTHLELRSKKLLNSTAHVTCSLLDPIKIGDIDQPLLDIIPLKENTDQNGNAYDYVFEPKHLKYRQIGLSSFQTIDITVENEQAELLHLDNSGVSTFSLKFIKG